MQLKDDRDCEVSGATSGSLLLFEEALRLFQSWRADPLPLVGQAIEQSPTFVMAHVLRSYIYLCSRAFSNVTKARNCFATLAGLAMNDRERQHLAIVNALINVRYESAEALLAGLLECYPRDVLALQVAHAFDYLLGNTGQLRDRVARVVPSWRRDVPGYSAVAAMHAFGLAESGEAPAAMDWCIRSLERDPGNPRVHHAIAHVYETTHQCVSGLNWLTSHVDEWAEATSVATHCWWHLALFHLRAGHPDTALQIYDDHIHSDRSATVAELIDASSLLWRLHLNDQDVRGRWDDLADKWTPYIAERFCAFNDLHAMMAFAGALRWQDATTLIESQILLARESDTNAIMTRTVGLPACKGVLAFGLERYAEAADFLSRLPAIAHRLGGSNAQHNIIALTHEAACRRVSAYSATFRMAA